MDGPLLHYHFVEQHILGKPAGVLVAHRVIRLAVIADAVLAKGAFSAGDVGADCDFIPDLYFINILSGFDYLAGNFMA